MSIIAISIYWRKNTPSLVTRWSRLATAPHTPTCIVIHGGQFTGGVHPSNQFVPEIVSPLPYAPSLVRHTLLIVYFFKELIFFIGSLDKCHTSVFNALILQSVCFYNPVDLRWTGIMLKSNCCHNPLPDDKILDWSKSKQIADDILMCI